MNVHIIQANYILTKQYTNLVSAAIQDLVCADNITCTDIRRVYVLIDYLERYLVGKTDTFELCEFPACINKAKSSRQKERELSRCKEIIQRAKVLLKVIHEQGYCFTPTSREIRKISKDIVKYLYQRTKTDLFLGDHIKRILAEFHSVPTQQLILGEPYGSTFLFPEPQKSQTNPTEEST